MIISDFRKILNDKKAVKKSIKDRLKKAEKELVKLEKKLVFAEQASMIIQLVSKQTQEQLEYKVSELVSLALKSVLDDPYEMRLRYETKRSKTEAQFLFEKNGKLEDPLTATGGGAVDIASFALRVALWNLSRNKTDNVLVLDEPFRFVSRDLLPKTGLMLREISKKLNLQIIMVSHLDDLIEDADKVFKVTKKRKVSRVQVVHEIPFSITPN